MQVGTKVVSEETEGKSNRSLGFDTGFVWNRERFGRNVAFSRSWSFIYVQLAV